MSSYTVTTTPQNIQNASPGTTTITNQGPATVYLDSNSAVSPTNGFPLLPTATLAWQEGQSVWVVTKSGTAQLVTNPAGHITDVGGLVPTNTLGHVGPMNVPYAGQNIGVWETSAYQTLYMDIKGLSVASGYPLFQISIQWLALDGSPMSTDTYYAVGPIPQNVPSGPPLNNQEVYCSFPVRGSAANITVQGLDATGITSIVSSFSDIVIYADNRERGVALRGNVASLYQNGTWNVQPPYNASFYGLVSYGMSATGVNRVFLDALGKNCTVRMHSTVAQTVTWQYMMPTSQIARIVYDSVPAGTLYQRTIQTLPGVPLWLEMSDLTHMDTFIVSWDDADPLVDPYSLPLGSAVNGSPILTDGNFLKGSESVTFSSQASVTGSVSFPANYFSAIPNVQVTLNHGFASVQFVPNTISVTASGFSYRVADAGGTARNGTLTLNWSAYLPS